MASRMAPLVLIGRAPNRVSGTGGLIGKSSVGRSETSLLCYGKALGMRRYNGDEKVDEMGAGTEWRRD